MGNRTNLYIVSAFLFPLAFAAFVVGFGCPVWIASSTRGYGLWQECFTVFENCTSTDFDGGGDWMIGVRAVEIFALVMLTIAAVDIVYENCFTNFRGRQLSERIAPGLLCILGGLGGLSGIIVFVVKSSDLHNGEKYSWALALVAAGSGLAVIIGVGFCVSGFFLENRKEEKPKGHMNGSGPYLTSNDENYEMSYTNKAMQYDHRGDNLPNADNLPGFAMYNGMLNRPGQRSSLPVGPSTYLPPYGQHSRSGPPTRPKDPQYYSVSDDRVLDPNFDLSEGYQPSRGRVPTRDQNSYLARRDENPYARGDRREDPYARVHRPPRAGYNDPYGFDRPRGDFDRPSHIRGNELSRDSFYRPGRF